MQEIDGQSVKDEAAAWFVRLRDEAAGDDERAAFEAWRAADPAHAQAYREMEGLWSGLDRIERHPRARNVSRRMRIRTDGPNVPGRRRVLRRLAAASVVVAVGLGAYSLTPPGLLADQRTGPGEQRKIELADGSFAHMNTASALSVDVTADRRLIKLHDGEAYFEVARDRARPFVVETDAGLIEALGTAFSVRSTDGTVEVTVTESKVAISDSGGGRTVLTAGQGISVTASGLGEVARTDANQALAWRRGRLVFDSRPLSEVLAELERYRAGRIVILDGAVAALPVTGSFAIADTDATLETIERILPVRLRRLSDLLVLVDAEPTT